MQPDITVLIASHNRREKLSRCLRTLCGQTQDPASFEVLVVDDGSDDGTAEMVEATETPFRLRLLRQANAGKATALNTAIEAAAAATCVFLDDDVIAAPGLLAAHLAAHREDPRTLGIGKLIQPPPTDGNWFGVAHSVAWNRRYDMLTERQPGWPDTYGGNFSAPRSKLIEAGGFATDLAAIEDIELGYRLCAAGCVPRYLPQASGIHGDEKPPARLLAGVEGYGEFCARFAESKPAVRPKLLGWFLEPTPRDVTLRRALLTLRVPARLLARAGGVIPGAPRKQEWFGFVTRYAFWSAARSAMTRKRWLQTTRGVPVLMYHAFSSHDEGDRFVVSRRRFSRHLRLLTLLRYRVIGLEQVARALNQGDPLPSRAVAITIDDGYEDNLEIALPLLARHRFPVTIFLVSDRLGTDNNWTEVGAVARRPLFDATHARLIRAEGVAIGAHTRSHPPLTEVPAQRLSEEIAGSRKDLEAILESPVDSFAYPYGVFDDSTAESARAAGFQAACTVENRLARPGDDPVLIPRVEIRGDDSLWRFLRKLWFGGA